MFRWGKCILGTSTFNTRGNVGSDRYDNYTIIYICTLFHRVSQFQWPYLGLAEVEDLQKTKPYLEDTNLRWYFPIEGLLTKTTIVTFLQFWELHYRSVQRSTTCSLRNINSSYFWTMAVFVKKKTLQLKWDTYKTHTSRIIATFWLIHNAINWTYMTKFLG